MFNSHCLSRLTAVLIVLFALAIPFNALDTGVYLQVENSDGDSGASSISITTLDVPITQNFDTLSTTGTTNTWTDDTTLAGWYAQFQNQPANPAIYRASTGADNVGAIYSFGIAGTNPITERALGSISSGTPGNIFYAVKLTNDTASTIGSIDVSFIAEQWRAAGCTPTPCTPAAQPLDFQYQVASAGVITDANTPSTGWTDFNSLDFTTPSLGTSTGVAIDGNALANRTAKAGTLTVSLSPGQEIWLRWMDTNDANNDHAVAIDDVSITPHGAPAAPEIDVTPTSIDFGNQQIGTTSAGTTVTVSNVGTDDLHISTVVTNNPVFSIVNSPAGTTIAPGGNAQFSVTFSPVIQNVYSGVLTISNDDADEGAFTMQLTGTGVNSPEIGVTPTSIAFGNQLVGTTSAPQTVTISNTGIGDLHIGTVVTGNSVFSITNSPAGTTISPGSSAQFTVRFTPATTSPYTSNLTISSDDADESGVVVPLSGTGVEPEIDVQGFTVSVPDNDTTPSTAEGTDFVGAATVGGTVVRTFTIRNTGTSQLFLGGTPRVAVSGTNAADFTVTVQPASTVAPSGSTTFQVTFDPSTDGLRTAELSILNNDADENPYNFAVQGVGMFAGTISVASATYTHSESNTFAIVKLSRNFGTDGTVSIDFATSNGTATAGTCGDPGADYQSVSGTQIWGPGDGADKNVIIPVCIDFVDESNETVNITLSNPTGGAALGPPSAAVLTIVDDDPVSTFSINDVSQTEGNAGISLFTFTVTKTGATELNTSVNFATADGTATQIVDYTSASGTLNFAPGETSKQISVAVNGDTDPETNQTFVVNLSSPVNAGVSDSQGQGTILTDDVVTALVVDTANDEPDGSCHDGDCGLRDAIGVLNPGGAISFSASFDAPQIIILSSELVISKNVVITGPGANLLTVTGSGLVRIFSVDSGSHLEVSGLKMDAGFGIQGGAIINRGGLTIDRCTISNSFSFGGIPPFGRGGAIYNRGTAFISNSTISNNIAEFSGGAIFNGDFVDSAMITIENSTISGNSAGSGGGVYDSNGGTRLSNSTIAFNTGNVAGGVLGSATVRSSIIAANVDNASIPDVAGTFVSEGFNLIGNVGTATGFSQPTDQVGPVPALTAGSMPLDPGLEPLGDYGGPTQTHALRIQPVSPAIDKGISMGLTTDQRGFIRTVDDPGIPNAVGGDGTDIGAYERLVPTAANVSVSGRVLTASGQGISGAKVTLSGGNLLEPLTVTTGTFGYFTFDGIQSGRTYMVSVETRRYVIAEPSRTVSVVDDVLDMNFVAEPLE